MQEGCPLLACTARPTLAFEHRRQHSSGMQMHQTSTPQFTRAGTVSEKQATQSLNCRRRCTCTRNHVSTSHAQKTFHIHLTTPQAAKAQHAKQRQTSGGDLQKQTSGAMLTGIDRARQPRTRNADTPVPDLQASVRPLLRRFAAAGTWQGSSDCPVTSRRPTKPPEAALPSPDIGSLLWADLLADYGSQPCHLPVGTPWSDFLMWAGLFPSPDMGSLLWADAAGAL